MTRAALETPRQRHRLTNRQRWRGERDTTETSHTRRMCVLTVGKGTCEGSARKEAERQPPGGPVPLYLQTTANIIVIFQRGIIYSLSTLRGNKKTRLLFACAARVAQSRESPPELGALRRRSFWRARGLQNVAVWRTARLAAAKAAMAAATFPKPSRKPRHWMSDRSCTHLTGITFTAYGAHTPVPHD